MPMLPEAPPRLSIMMRAPSCAASGSAIRRAVMSTLPPGGNGEIMRMGWLGYGCAASGGAAASASIASSRGRIFAVISSSSRIFVLLPNRTGRGNGNTAGRKPFPASFGLGPNLLSPGSLSLIRKIRRTIHPRIGISPMSHHQPLRPVSCRRRKKTAREGNSVAKLKMVPRASNLERITTMSTTARAMKIRLLNRTKYQYSLRRARPENVAYFFNAARYHSMTTSPFEHRRLRPAGRTIGLQAKR